MPNHVTNLLTVTGDEEKIAAFRAKHVHADHFAFETVIPKPACVEATSRPFESNDEMVGDAEVEHYARALLTNYFERILPGDGVYHMPPTVITWRDLIRHYDRTSPTVAKWAKARLLCAAETGYPGWYEWSIANWGTKWGAYDYKEREFSAGRFIFEFQTAWSVPRPILAALADLWPDLTIEIEAIDEGGPEYVGRFHGAERTLDKVPEDAARYVRVYGREPYRDDEDEEDAPAEAGL